MEGNLQSVLKVARMEVTQNRGLTLCPTDVLSDSDDETPEDLGLSTSLSIHLREDSWDISPGGHLQSVSWSLAEFRHNKIVQSPHENYFNVCRQHKEK